MKIEVVSPIAIKMDDATDAALKNSRKNIHRRRIRSVALLVGAMAEPFFQIPDSI